MLQSANKDVTSQPKLKTSVRSEHEQNCHPLSCFLEFLNGANKTHQTVATCSDRRKQADAGSRRCKMGAMERGRRGEATTHRGLSNQSSAFNRTDAKLHPVGGCCTCVVGLRRFDAEICVLKTRIFALQAIPSLFPPKDINCNLVFFLISNVTHKDDSE